MTTRRYDLNTGIETSSTPTVSDPSTSTDIMSKGYADKTYAARQYWGHAVADTTALKALSTTGDAQRYDQQIVLKDDDNTLWKFDSASSATEDLVSIIQPTTGTGRWLICSGGSGSGSGGGVGVDAYDSFLLQRKTAQTYDRAPNSHTIIEPMTESNGLVLTLAKAYSTSDTTIYLHENMSSIDDMDATTGWTAGTNTPTIALDTSNKIEDTGSVSMTKASLNGSMTMYKSIAFNLYKRAFRAWVRLDTVSNLDSNAFKIYLESSGGNYKTYTFASSRFSAGTWVLLECDSEEGTDTGTPIITSITKVTFELTTTSSQTITANVDYLVSVTNQDLINTRYAGISLPIWDATNQEFMILTAEDSTEKGKYTLASTLSANYAIATSYSKDYGLTVNGVVGQFESASGAHAKTQYVVNRQIFSQGQINKTLQTKVGVIADSFEVYDAPSGTSFRISGDYTARFKSGDKVIIWYSSSESFLWLNKSYAEFDSTWDAGYRVLTLTSDSTYSAPYTTVTFTANHDVSSVKNLLLMRIPLVVKGYVGTSTSNESVADLTLENFYPANRVILFTDDFNRANNSTNIGGNWSRTVNSIVGGTHTYGISGNVYAMTGYNGSDITISHYPTNNPTLMTKNFEVNLEMFTGSDDTVNFFASQFQFCFGEADQNFNSTSKYKVVVQRSQSSLTDVQVIIYENGSNIASATLPNLQETWLSVKISVKDKIVRAKVWTRGTAEKQTWDVSYLNAIWDLNMYWGFLGVITSSGAAASSWLYIDNFSLVSGDSSGTYFVYEDPSKTGNKMVIAAAINRQDTTNDSPLLASVVSSLI